MSSSSSAFASRDYRFFFASRVLSALGHQMEVVALGWLVYAMTESAFALGLIGLASFFPVLLMSLVSGHVADQFDRRKIAIACYALITLASVGLIICASIGRDALYAVYALTVLLGIARSFSNPATQALMPTLVPREALPNGISWSTSAWQTASIVGPALGGLLYALGPQIVFAVAALMFVSAAFSLFAIKTRRAPQKREPATLTAALAGIRFMREKPVILGAISLDLFAVLLGGATALLPIYARDILMTGPWGLGLLRAMPSLGAVLMGVMLARFPLERKAGSRMLVSVAIFGLATIIFGVSTNLYLSMGALFVLGASDMISVYVRQTLVQAETPDAMRGRVSAVSTVFIGASNELGEFESGMMAAALGTVPSVIVGGLGSIVVVALWAWFFPSLRKRDHLITPHDT
ncbi:MAG: MFS transporter [Alphaproteobacteria bacterium]|nr:MFS transporter [Alphaproteobacteria bacterium]